MKNIKISSRNAITTQEREKLLFSTTFHYIIISRGVLTNVLCYENEIIQSREVELKTHNFPNQNIFQPFSINTLNMYF